MADPVVTVCTENAWTLVAENAQGGIIHNLNTSADYLWTYRDPGEPAPASTTGMVLIPFEDARWKLPESVKADYYIYCRKADGSVRFDDLPATSDVFLQDQTTPWGDFYALQAIGAPTTLTADTIRGAYTIDVASVANISTGDYIGIFAGAGGDEKKQFATVLNIATLTLTLDTQVDRVFPETTGVVVSFLRDMNVDGSVTPQVFEIQAGGPAGDLEIDLTRLVMKCYTTTATPLNKFGDLTALTRGFVCRILEPDGNYCTKFNAKDNGSLKHLAYDLDTTTAGGQGQDGWSWRFTLNGQDKHGVPQRIKSNIQTIQFVIQDDLTGLESLEMIGANQEVD